VSLRDREGLIARIRQVRRVATPTQARTPTVGGESDSAKLDALQERVAHLEQLLEGLQDSVHREAERQRKLIADLQGQIQPSAMSAALSKDARERGLG
jgi:ABC-type phosphate transport system auxiliary subunit